MGAAWFKGLPFAACLLPAVWYGWALAQGGLGANPVEALIHGSGDWALRLLLATLALGLSARRLGWRSAPRLGRMLGLFTFAYAALHLGLWLWLEKWFLWAEVWADLVERPYILLGAASLLILALLAALSNEPARRRLGAWWFRAHRLAWLAAGLAVAHFWLLVKADLLEPAIYAAVLTVLVVERGWSAGGRNGKAG